MCRDNFWHLPDGIFSKRTFVHRFRGRTQRPRRLRFAACGGRATAHAARAARAARWGRRRMPSHAPNATARRCHRTPQAAHHRALEAEAETNTKAARSSVYNLQSLGGGEWSSAHDSYRTAFMTALMTVQWLPLMTVYWLPDDWLLTTALTVQYF